MGDRYDFQKMVDTISDRNDEIAELRAELADARAENERMRYELKGISGAIVDAGDILCPAGIYGQERAVREIIAQRDALQARIDGVHNWVRRDIAGHAVDRRVDACKWCGVVRRADDKNKPCKGVVEITLREESEG